MRYTNPRTYSNRQTDIRSNKITIAVSQSALYLCIADYAQKNNKKMKNTITEQREKVTAKWLVKKTENNGILA